jgi:hypothetical protein
LNFGAKGDGVTDDTAAIQAAVTAALGRSLYFPPGFYVINSEITISGSITIFGAGVEISVIQLGTTTQNGFNIACDSSVHFRDMKVFGGASQTAGAAIKVNGATNGVTTNLNSTFENLLFSQCWNSIEFISVASARIHNCVINGILNVGVTVQDTVNADSTPSWITDCAFFGNSSSASLKGISHLSGGGLRVVNNYFNTLGAAYHMNWGSTVGSSQIRIANNTVDSNQQVGGFIFDRSTASGGIAGISIVGNYLFTNTVTPAIWFKKNDPGVFVNTTLNGNNFILSGGGTGIQIDGGIAYEICGNQFTGPTGTGIATVNSTATSIQIGPNQFTNISTAYSINTASQITPTAIHGTGSNDNANASDIGEYSTATIATGSSLSLTSPNALNVTNFTLTPGDWDVWGVIDYLAGGATTFTVMKSGISTTSATIGSQDTFTNLALAGTLAAASDMAQTTPTVRISIASSTIVYLVAQVTFAVSTLKVYGSIFARRVR